jgi:trans-L-3-hydroxyproline dehydratase
MAKPFDGDAVPGLSAVGAAMALATESGTAIETVEMHTGGEPVRIVVSGYPEVPGPTLLDRRRYVRDRLDHLRRRLIFEPRGHVDMYGALPQPADHPGAAFAVLFMHNEGYSTMCGHAVIALGRWAVDSGRVPLVEPETNFGLQCPCGLVRVRVAASGGRTGRVRFESVPAFAYALDREVEVDGVGRIAVDVGYGGAFYAFVPAARFGLDVRSSPVAQLVDAADRVSRAVKAQVPIRHPDEADLGYLYGTILTDGRDRHSEQSTANICVFADRQVDRSPTGSGVTARIAIQLARGQISLGQERRFESVTGAQFTGRGLAMGQRGEFATVVVEVGGEAHYVGTARFTAEAGDPLADGFLLR